MKSLRIQERDREILRLTNGFGFVTLKMLAGWYNTHYTTIQKRVKKLCDAGFMLAEHILWSGEKAYRVTKLGTVIIEDDLKPLGKISLGTYMHDIRLLDLIVHLKKKHGFTDIIPERRLKHINGMNNPMKGGHIYDALLITENSKKIAIELELSLKTKARLNKIVGDYISDFDLHEVWYFTPSSAIRNSIAKAASGHSDFIKIYDIGET